jgi:hypothetical protein
MYFFLLPGGLGKRKMLFFKTERIIGDCCLKLEDICATN